METEFRLLASALTYEPNKEKSRNLTVCFDIFTSVH
jgi:hypothetical protein